MPESEEKREGEHKEPETSKEPHSTKSNHLLWWGLGIGALGLLVTLYLASRNNSSGGTTVQASQPFIPNPTDVSQGLTSTNTPIPSQYQTANNAPANDYWPPVPSPVLLPPNNNGQTQGGTSDSDSDNGRNNNRGNNNRGNNNNNQNSGPPPVQLPSHNAYVYTTRPGETLASLTNKFGWSPDKQKGGGVAFTYNYGNNSQIFSALGIGVGDSAKVIPTGTQIAA